MSRAPDDRSSRASFDAWSDRHAESVERSERESTFPFDGYTRVLARVVEVASPLAGARVLELGAGTGRLTERLVAAGARVTAVDQSEPMTRGLRADPAGPRVLHMDMLDRRALAALGPVDVVAASYALHELPPQDGIDFLAWLVGEVVAEGGRGVFGDIWFADARSRCEAQSRWGRLWDTNEHYWPMDEITRALTLRGCSARYEQISSCAGVLEVRR